MARAPKTETGKETAPKQLADVAPPTDLYALSDIRIVMRDLGKLSAQVERLINDVASHGGKIDDVRHQITFVRGAMYVVGALLALLVVVAGWLITHVSIVLKP